MNSTNTGWINREGTFFPCAFQLHSKYAESIGFSEKILEDTGWVKTTILDNKPIFTHRKHLSIQQQDTLEQLGFNLENNV